MSYRFCAALLGTMLIGCAHAPETVVHLSAPPSGRWLVRDARGAPLCALPCSVELETNESIAVAREGGTQFVVQQEQIGPGAWIGDVRVREERAAGAIAVQSFAGALASAGAALVETRRQDRVVPGLVLSALGTAGVLASDAWPAAKREELWLQRTSAIAR